MIAVDRLHRFRWSGGGGGSGKKSSSGPRSEKAERLRELTEKLKGPAPVPPPRRPSRVQASSPPPSGYQPSSQNYPQVRNSNVTVTRCRRLRLLNSFLNAFPSAKNDEYFAALFVTDIQTRYCPIVRQNCSPPQSFPSQCTFSARRRPIFQLAKAAFRGS